jgi:iron(III) transport system substrate-binding protein
MRRYLPILLISFFVLVTIITGSTSLQGYADEQNPEKNIKSINVYTALPIEQLSILAQEYEKSQKVRVNLVPLSEANLLTKIKVEMAAPQADIIIANSVLLEQVQKLNVLKPYTSEQTDIIPDRFKDANNYWTGIWYDPIVFAANRDFLKTLPKVPTKWNDLTQDDKYRIGITDFLAAEASANLFYTLIATNGETQTFSYLRKLHPQIVQYAKFLTTPVRMAGMGEVDIAIATQSETIRYMNDKFPITLLYPEDGTSFVLTGAALIAGTQNEVEAKQFIDWLLQDAAQSTLYTSSFYFIPTNPETIIYKYYDTKNIKLLSKKENFTIEQKSQLLDKWITTIRLASK